MRILPPNHIWRDQPAQRLQLSGCGSKLAPSEENVKNKEMAGI